jgi:hypothetical protein
MPRDWEETGEAREATDTHACGTGLGADGMRAMQGIESTAPPDGDDKMADEILPKSRWMSWANLPMMIRNWNTGWAAHMPTIKRTGIWRRPGGGTRSDNRRPLPTHSAMQLKQRLLLTAKPMVQMIRRRISISVRSMAQLPIQKLHIHRTMMSRLMIRGG